MAHILVALLSGLFGACTEFISSILEIGTPIVLANPLSEDASVHFAWFRDLLAYVQVICFGVALAIRIFGAAKEGLLSSFRGDPYAAAAWLFDTVWVLVLIVAAPMLCSWCAEFAYTVGNDISGVAGSAYGFDTFAESLQSVIDSEEGEEALSDYQRLILYVIAVVMVYYCISVLLQCIKRQILTIFLSIVLPIVITTESMGELEFSKSHEDVQVILFAGFITALQLILLQSVMAVVVTQATEMDIAMWAILSVALLGAIKNIPEWIANYVQSPVSSGHSGSKIAMASSYAMKSLGGRTASVGQGALQGIKNFRKAVK